MSTILVMGVSGCGKTTVGELLAAKLNCSFLEGDSYHPQANIDKMHNGEPLDDEDRWPWLERISDDIARWNSDGIDGVVSCSALKKSYRDLLRQGDEALKIIYLAGSYDLLHERLSARNNHFMPAKLLDSQFDALEDPRSEPGVYVANVANLPGEIVASFLAAKRSS